MSALTAPRPAAEAMLIERLIPEYDAVRAEHRLVPGNMETVYRAARDADFARAGRDNPPVRALFAVRSLAERAASALRDRPCRPQPEVARLRLADLPASGEWVLLGESPPREIAFGAIGRFWAGETVWERIEGSDFTAWNRAGFARIACNLSLRPYGAAQVLVSYECRTAATDAASRRAFLRYWRPLSPFIGVVWARRSG